VVTVANIVLPWNSSAVSQTREPEALILEGLRALALADEDVAARAENLFLFLRKISTDSSAREYLMGIQYLAVTGDPAGARLLAAFLDVSTPGDRLLPRVQRFTSSRRLSHRIREAGDDPGNLHEDWLERLEDLASRARGLVPVNDTEEKAASTIPGRESPWPQLRDAMDLLVARLSLGDDFSADDRQLLVELLRLEIDAWQERISHLAGSIHPFEVAAITRVLPILSIADAEIRDLRQMTGWISEGCLGSDFQKPLSRSLDILEDNDRAMLRKVLEADPALEPLAKLFTGVADRPVRISVMGYILQKLQAVSDRLALLGIPEVDLDLVTGALLVQENFAAGSGEENFHLPLTPGFPRACGHILEMAESGMGTEAADLAGLVVQGEKLVISIPEGGAFLEHDLPAAAAEGTDDGDPDEVMDWAEDLSAEPDSGKDADEKIDPDTATASELKHLVMTNLQSLSILLGFLRSPKIVAIPGLVEEVVNRTRNPKVIETVCQVRVMHTGFANRSVPLACLRSPVNVPISALRKFMHVKYVPKVDLKRIAADQAGVRKEVGREVQKYLKSLT
jgi:hypothetical protein